jgi:hypothetical protein
MTEPHVVKENERVLEAENEKVEVDQTRLSQMKFAISLIGVVLCPS